MAAKRAAVAEPMKYRPDIDGLRALAVLAVVLFHADVAGFSGGYVGVDVFFVISGFLITRLVCSQALEGRFSFADFYVRRLRRLFPALLSTLLVTGAAALALLSNHHLRMFARSLVASLASLSNVFFWSESGYFGEAARLKPLLHTWSLSVEEQYYLVWPGLLWLTVRFAPRRTFALVALLTLLSFAAFVTMLTGDEYAAFFLMPFRMWELGLGALLVWIVGRSLAAPAAEALSVLGLAAIAVAVQRFDAAMFDQHGAWLIAPCLGAACVIVGGEARYAGAVLRARPSVFVGRLSYSLYLVHWPVITLYRYYTFEPLTTADVYLVVGVSLACAWLLWYFVEERFRERDDAPCRLTRGRFALACAGCAVTLATGAWVIAQTGGFERALDRKNANILAYLIKQEASKDAIAKRGSCYLFDSSGPFDRKVCLKVASDRPNVLVVGDSYAAAAYSGMVERYGTRVNLNLLAAASCRPLLDPTTRLNGCAERNALFFGELDLAPYQLIVLAGAIEAHQASALQAAIARLRARTTHAIVVLGSPQGYSESVKDIFRRFGADEPTSALLSRVREHTSPMYLEADRALRHAALGAPYVSMLDVLCPTQRATQCQVALPRSDKPLISDQGHLTVEAAAWVLGELDRLNPAWRSVLAPPHG